MSYRWRASISLREQAHLLVTELLGAACVSALLVAGRSPGLAPAGRAAEAASAPPRRLQALLERLREALAILDGFGGAGTVTS